MSTASSAPSWRSLLTREHWFVFPIASLAWLFDCMDQQFFNLGRAAAMDQLLPDKSKALEYGSYTTSVFLIGWAVGGLTLGSLGDQYGRARMLTVSVLLYSIFTGLSALSTGFWDFCAYRFLTGVGVGGVFGLAVALVADTVPDKARAPALGLLQSLSSIGNISAGLIGMGIGMLAARELLPMGLKTWQAMFIVGGAPAFLCVFILAKLKEPQRWVDARAAGKLSGIKFGSYGSLLTNPKWKKNAWAGLAMCSVGIIGLWGIGNFHPTIVGSIVGEHLKSSGISAEKMASEKAFWSSMGLLLQNIGAFAGMTTMAWVAQVKGRKFAFALSMILSFGTTVLVFQGMRQFSDIFWMIPLMGFGQLGAFAIYAIYLPELFPTSLRATGTSFCYNFGRVVAATAPFTVGQITKSLSGNLEGFRTAGTVMSLVMLLGLLVLPFLPETKDKPLPEE